MNKKITHLEETAENYSFREMAESFCKLLKTDRKMFFIYLRIFKMQYDKQRRERIMYTKRNKHICMNCKNLIADKLISKDEGISLVMICSKGHENKSESCEDHELKSFDWGLK